MTEVTTDVRHHIARGCAMDTDYFPIDGQVEVIVGDLKGRRSVIRLVVDDVDTAHRLMEAARAARNILAAHLYGDEADEAAAPTVDKPSPDRSQSADSPAGTVERHLTSV
jgi:hypothetical protein